MKKSRATAYVKSGCVPIEHTHVAMSASALWTCALFALASARIYERCELARDLQSLGVKQEHISTWVCIAFHESRFDTAANNRYSGDHGILQISELYWCGPGKACGVSCPELRDDNIMDDLHCAQIIYEEHTRLQGNGFLAWVVYPQHCKQNTKKYLADCDFTYHKESNPKLIDQRSFQYDKNQSFSYEFYPQVDELKPPYFLTTTTLVGSNKNKLIETRDGREEYVKNSLHFKIGNIDELKLPMFHKHLTHSTTAISTSPSATTSPRPAVPNKQIDTNQFQIRPFTTNKTIEMKETVSRTQQFFTTKVQPTSNSNFNHLLPVQTKTATYKPSAVVTTAKPLITKTRYAIASGNTTPSTIKFTSRVTGATSPKTDKLLPFVIKSHSSTTDIGLPFIFTTSPSTATPITATKTNLTTSNLGTSKIFPFIYKNRKEERSTKSTPTRPTQSTSKAMPFIFTLSTTTSSKTSTPILRHLRTQKLLTTTPLSTTPRPSATRTSAPRISATKITTAVKTTLPPKTTRSLFDLYLNPTKRPILAPYRVPQDNNSYKLKIFSGGTTTLAPTYQYGDIQKNP